MSSLEISLEKKKNDADISRAPNPSHVAGIELSIGPPAKSSFSAFSRHSSRYIMTHSCFGALVGEMIGTKGYIFRVALFCEM